MSQNSTAADRPGIVTLTTDFGVQDGYVGAMKGVVLEIAGSVTVVDITHEIPPQDVEAGAYIFHTAYPHFPDGTIHVVVVDPGVGRKRRGLVVETARYRFVGPDNGVFTPVFQAEADCRMVSLENPEWMRKDVSATFHGRDVFAPAAGYLCQGVEIEAFGPFVTDPVMLDVWAVREEADRLTGRIVHVDRFGNGISNLSEEQVEAAVEGRVVEIGGQIFHRIHRTYGDVVQGEPLLLYGSQGTLEISVNGGSAAEEMGVQRGDEVRLIGKDR
ncbi:MAG: SAM-dependent chlorinase/fluorinase [bacterium]|nr:SAM-dependent chlorinase/fluorinase [bacterium]